MPVDEDNNEHKKRQLKELAEINGTLRVDAGANFLDLRAKEDEENSTMYRLSDDVKAKAAAQYAKDVELMHGPGAGGQLDNAYSDFLSELGVDKSMARGGAPGGSGVVGARSGLGFQGGGSFRGGSDEDGAKLYVGHLPPTMTAEQMLEMFKPFGRVLQIDVIPDRERQLACKGFAFVQFSTPEEAVAAKALSGTVIEGQTRLPSTKPPSSTSLTCPRTTARTSSECSSSRTACRPTCGSSRTERRGVREGSGSRR